MCLLTSKWISAGCDRALSILLGAARIYVIFCIFPMCCVCAVSEIDLVCSASKCFCCCGLFCLTWVHFTWCCSHARPTYLNCVLFAKRSQRTATINFHLLICTISIKRTLSSFYLVVSFLVRAMYRCYSKCHKKRVYTHSEAKYEDIKFASQSQWWCLLCAGARVYLHCSHPAWWKGNVTEM